MRYFSNSVSAKAFAISADKINPLLDVTFDGVHILNSDIVSAKPNILIQLKDENRFLALNDTNDYHLFLQLPFLCYCIKALVCFFNSQISAFF